MWSPLHLIYFNVKKRFILTLNYVALIYSYAELPKEEKNSISHRYRALAAMSEHFSQTKDTSPENKKKKEQED